MQIPSFILAVSLFVALTLAVLHAILLPGVPPLRLTKLPPRWLTYVLGSGTVLAGWVAVSVWLRQPELILYLVTIYAGAALPTLAFRVTLKDPEPGQPMSDRQAHQLIDTASRQAKELANAGAAQDYQVQP